jgi:hypothetical protein
MQLHCEDAKYEFRAYQGKLQGSSGKLEITLQKAKNAKGEFPNM